MTVVTRFAPSPTGFLHIGGARTALFNWLYAKHNNGKFLLRIEDTDRERSTDEAVQAIIDGMKWLGLDWNDDVYHQFSFAKRHQEVVQQLLDSGNAYYCYCSQEELDEMRQKAIEEKRSFKYDGRWRDRDPKEAPEGVKPVVRIKAPQDGESVIEDLVQGRVVVNNSELDDMILLRSDGTPTYMLAVVVDDYDMGVTHVIRGDDHLNNAFRQKVIYEAMGWEVPRFSHIPLINGPDGAKLSKRHGALGVCAYRDMGFLPEAMRNYLLRLGWSHGDDEIISTEDAIKWFNLDNVGKSPSRFDFDKLDHINGHYIRESDNAKLAELIYPLLEAEGFNVSADVRERVKFGMEGLKQRAKRLTELAEAASIYAFDVPSNFTDKASKALDSGKEFLPGVREVLENLDDWSHDSIEAEISKFAESQEAKLGKVCGPIRAALTGSHMSPSVFEMLEVLGKEISLKRIAAVL